MFLGSSVVPPDPNAQVDQVVEIVLEEVWTEKLMTREPPKTIFVANDWRGERRVCLIFCILTIYGRYSKYTHTLIHSHS